VPVPSPYSTWLERPSHGKVDFLGNELYEHTNEDYRADVRKKHIGMVYQQANWIKSLNVIENIGFPLQLLGMDKSLALERARKTLGKFHLEDWAEYYPTELSSGQQQRIAMARAIVHNPMIIVADEPTGNLDYESGENVMELLSKMNQKDGKTIIMVTHDLDYLSYAKTAVQFFDGEIVGLYRGNDKEKIAEDIKQRKRYFGKNSKNEKKSTSVSVKNSKDEPKLEKKQESTSDGDEEIERLKDDIKLGKSKKSEEEKSK